MTREEVNQLMGVVKANWPSAFKGLSKSEKQLVYASWCLALIDINAEAASLAIVKLVATSKWPPTVSEIREKVQKIYYEASFMTQGVEFAFRDPEQQKALQAASRRLTNATCHIRGDDISEPSISSFILSATPVNLLHVTNNEPNTLLIEGE